MSKLKFRYGFVRCPECKEAVADNWIIKHLKSDCSVGIPAANREATEQINARELPTLQPCEHGFILMCPRGCN